MKSKAHRTNKSLDQFRYLGTNDSDDMLCSKKVYFDLR